MLKNTDFYDVAHLLTYKRLFNIAMGNRTAGKSFSCKRFLLRQFLKYGKQFVFLVRRTTEVGAQTNGVFNDVLNICPEFKNTEMVVKNDTFLINKETAGFIIPLSQEGRYKKKSGMFTDVYYILFDEYIADTQTEYLKDEYNKIVSFLTTVSRGKAGEPTRFVPIFFLCNAVSVINPLFNALKLIPKMGVVKGFNYVCECFVNEKVAQLYNQTQLGVALNATSYGDMALKNAFLLDDYSFVKNVTLKDYILKALLKINGNIWGYWTHKYTNEGYISQQYNSFCPFRYVFNIDDVAEDWLYIKSNTKTIKGQLLKLFTNNLLYFESLKIKNDVIEVLQF